MNISKHVLVMACVVVPCLVASAMPRPVARLAPELVTEIKSALNSNMPKPRAEATARQQLGSKFTVNG